MKLYDPIVFALILILIFGLVNSKARIEFSQTPEESPPERTHVDVERR